MNRPVWASTGDALADHAIGGEAEGQDEGDPRQVAQRQRPGTATPTAARPMATQPQRSIRSRNSTAPADHVEQRVDVVAEAGLQRRVMGRGPDVDGPS